MFTPYKSCSLVCYFVNWQNHRLKCDGNGADLQSLLAVFLGVQLLPGIPPHALNLSLLYSDEILNRISETVESNKSKVHRKQKETRITRSASVFPQNPDLNSTIPIFALYMPIDLHLAFVDLLLIRQHQLNHPNNTPFRKPKPHNLKPRPLHQFSPLPLTALQRRQRTHHVQVRPTGELWAVLAWQDVFVDQDLRVAGFHSYGSVFEDGANEVVRPIVQDVAEAIRACACRSFRPLSA